MLDTVRENALSLALAATAIGKGVDRHRLPQSGAEIFRASADVLIKEFVGLELHRRMGVRMRSHFLIGNASDFIEAHHRRRSKSIPFEEQREQLFAERILLRLGSHLDKVGQAMSEAMIAWR